MLSRRGRSHGGHQLILFAEGGVTWFLPAVPAGPVGFGWAAEVQDPQAIANRDWLGGADST